MDIREQIKEIIEGLSPGESILALGTMIDALRTETEKITKENHLIFNIPITSIDLFPNHPFYVENDEDMMDLVKSIKKYGMLTPGAVRIKEDGRYELLSGHRRLWACKLAGITEFRCEVLSLTEEEAAHFMIEANRQRPKILPGEKGQVYKLKIRFDEPYRDLRELRIDASDNPYRIRSFLRLGDLIPELVELVDQGKMSLRPASVLSQLPKKYQRMVYEEIDYEQCLPSHAQAIRMKKLNDMSSLTQEAIVEIMEEDKPNQKPYIKISEEDILSHIPTELSVKQQHEYIAKALKFYEKSRRK